MTWDQIHTWLCQNRFLNVEPVGGVAADATKYVDVWIEEVASFEMENRPRINAIVSAIIKGTPLTELTSVEKCLLAQRQAFALGLCLSLMEREPTIEEDAVLFFGASMSHAQKLEYVLITAWEQLGRHLYEYTVYWHASWERASRAQN